MTQKRSAWSHSGGFRAQGFVCLYQSCPSIPAAIKSSAVIRPQGWQGSSWLGRRQSVTMAPLGIWFALSMPSLALAQQWDRYGLGSRSSPHHTQRNSPPFLPFPKAHLQSGTLLWREGGLPMMGMEASPCTDRVYTLACSNPRICTHTCIHRPTHRHMLTHTMPRLDQRRLLHY